MDNRKRGKSIRNEKKTLENGKESRNQFKKMCGTEKNGLLRRRMELERNMEILKVLTH
jgi:hypothetical protein